ncbi:hypothetical protein ACR820_29875 [Streptomyces netropsis]
MPRDGQDLDDIRRRTVMRRVLGTFVLVGVLAVSGVAILKDIVELAPQVRLPNGLPVPDTTVPAPREYYRLTTPDSILDGTYTRVYGNVPTSFLSAKDRQFYSDAGITDARFVTAAYRTVRYTKTDETVQLDGMWGKVKNPAWAVDSLLGTFATAAFARKEAVRYPDGAPLDVSTAGSEGGMVMKCQRAMSRQLLFTPPPSTYLVCIWADHSTVGFVTYYDMAAARSHKAPSVRRAAEVAARTRKETRVPENMGGSS